MNVLPFEKRVQIASALVDGMSIRAAERLLGVHRDSVMRFGTTAGEACATFHDAMVRDVQATLIQADELWTFIQKKERRVRSTDPAEFGDQYVFLAIDSVSKLIVSYRVGKRDGVNTRAFIADLRARVLGRPQISTDGWPAYPDAIDEAFGRDVDYAQVVKDYAAPQVTEASRRYSPARLLRVTNNVVCGEPDEDAISTSHVERLNLSVRVSLKRFARLTISHSKKLRNLEAAVGLFVAWFNFVRVHETLRCTPAMQAGLADHVWSMAELLQTAFAMPTPPPLLPPGQQSFPGLTAAQAKGEGRGSYRGPRRPRLRVIKGGLAS
jgi:IS1 family transposase